MSIRIGSAVAGMVLAAATTTSFAQHSPEEVRKLLGQPVSMAEAAVLGAARASHSDLCGGPTEFEGHASVVSRLQYGSLGPADRDRLAVMMTRQHGSNAAIYETLDDDAKIAFCSGLASTVLAKTAEFVEAHPHLFEQRDVPAAEPKAFDQTVAEIMAGMAPFERMYVIRMTENFVMDDARKILADPASEKDGYAWAMKVLAYDFSLLSRAAEPDHPDVAEAYRERAEIYSRYIRGEIDGPAMQAAETANERRKNAVYDRMLQSYSRTVETPPKSRVTELEAVAKVLARMVSGRAKVSATD